MDERLHVTAAANGGFVTRAEALDLGWTDRELAGAVRRGRLRHIRHGAYAPADVFDAADDSTKHLIVARAALTRQRGEVALTGVSAAAAHGLDLYGQDLSAVHLVRLDDGSSRTRVRTQHHVLSARPEGVKEVNGVQAVGVARAVWEVAATSTLESAVCTADSALRLHPGLRAELDELAPLFAHRRGSRTARTALRLADGRSATVGESRSRVQFHIHDLPAPDLQYEVRASDGRLLGISDFLWDLYRHLGEFDGKIKYGRLRRPDQEPEDVVFSEKRREDLMRGELFGMSRWVWLDLAPTHVVGFIGRLWLDMERSRRLYGHSRTIIA